MQQPDSAAQQFTLASPGEVHLPDYRGGGIANLMASLCGAMGGGDTGYCGLAGLDTDTLSRARHIVLMVVDGLGYDYLMGYAGDSLLASHCKARMSSVCPSTTTTAIPLFLTGVPPQQHGFTGWFTYFSELGSVLAVLPFRSRLGSFPIESSTVTPAELSATMPLSRRIDRPSLQLMPEWIANSAFNRAFAGSSKITAFSDLAGMRRALARSLRRAKGGSYNYLYWPEFDALAHHHGVDSPNVHEHLTQLDDFFAKLLGDLSGSDTLLLITADHGFIDSPAQRNVDLNDHPELQQMLMAPLCGEPRLAFSYIHPHSQQQFERYVQEQLSEQIMLFPSSHLFEKGWFGIGEPHPRLLQRIGHYALVMKDNWTISGTLPGERAPQHIGVHGGVSAAEMYVPLIYAEC